MEAQELLATSYCHHKDLNPTPPLHTHAGWAGAGDLRGHRGCFVSPLQDSEAGVKVSRAQRLHVAVWGSPAAPPASPAWRHVSVAPPGTGWTRAAWGWPWRRSGAAGGFWLCPVLQRRRVRPERPGPPTPVPARGARGALALPERRGRASWHTRTAPRTRARAVRGAPSCAADSPAGEHRTCAPHCLQCAMSVLTRLKEGQVQSAVTARPWRAGPWASRAEERAASLEEVASSPHLRWQHSR